MRCLCLILFIFTGSITFGKDVVKLSGKIDHPLSDSVLISYNDNRIAYFPKEYYAHVDKNGNFSISFPVPAGIYIQADLVHGRKVSEMILHSGDSLYMTADAAHFDSTVHYKGRGSEVANFVCLHTLERGRMNRYTIKIKAAISKPSGDFLKEIATERFGEEGFLNLHKAGLPPGFIRYCTAYFQYYNYFFTQQYPQVHEMIKRRKYTDSIPEENFRVLTEMPYVFNDTLLQVPSYLLYLTGVFEIKLKAAGYGASGNDPDKMRQVEDSIYRLCYKILPPKSAEYYIAQSLYSKVKFQDAARTDSLFNTFKKHWPVSEYLPLLNKQISMAKRLAKGQPAPDFSIITPEGKSLRLSDLKGKVVYLSFWASGCKQCVGEMINEKRIKGQLKNTQVEFVYLSIDEDTTTSNLLVSKFNLGGIFTHAKGGWYAKEVQLYGVQGLPAYFLIDKEGKFALQNTPSPGDPKQLISEIEQLTR